MKSSPVRAEILFIHPGPEDPEKPFVETLPRARPRTAIPLDPGKATVDGVILSVVEGSGSGTPYSLLENNLRARVLDADRSRSEAR